MTAKKGLKRRIRARARKTGESYTTARLHTLRSRDRRRTRAHPAPAAAPRALSAGIASEARIAERTGHGLPHWFRILDRFGTERGHTALAKHLREEHGVDGWYSQTITVAYERARGLRAVNRNVKGEYGGSVSRVVPATVAEAVAALKDPDRRGDWLDDAELEAGFRKALPKGTRRLSLTPSGNASVTVPLREGSVIVSAGVTARRTSVTMQAQKLPSAAALAAFRKRAAAALDGLRSHLREA